MYYPRILYKELAGLVCARLNCEKSGNSEWFVKHTETINRLVSLIPDAKIDLSVSHADKLILYTSFHHMNENGFWDGYTDHTIIVKPSLQFDFTLRITGPNRNDVKEYLAQTFDYALRKDVTYELFLPSYPEFAIASKWENEDGSVSQCYQAWYCSDGARFWNNPDGARKHAGELMQAKHFSR